MGELREQRKQSERSELCHDPYILVRVEIYVIMKDHLFLTCDKTVAGCPKKTMPQMLGTSTAAERILPNGGIANLARTIENGVQPVMGDDVDRGSRYDMKQVVAYSYSILLEMLAIPLEES